MIMMKTQPMHVPNLKLFFFVLHATAFRTAVISSNKEVHLLHWGWFEQRLHVIFSFQVTT